MGRRASTLAGFTSVWVPGGAALDTQRHRDEHEAKSWSIDWARALSNGQRVRMAEVAALAGVSVTTVSHVLNDVPGKRIPPQTGQRVRDAAAELGYVVNGLARSLRLQQTHVLAFISDEVLTTPFAAAMVHGALEAAAELGWMVVLTNTGVDRNSEADQIRALQQRQVDGFLYVRMYNQEVTLPSGLPDHVHGPGRCDLLQPRDRVRGAG